MMNTIQSWRTKTICSIIVFFLCITGPLQIAGYSAKAYAQRQVNLLLTITKSGGGVAIKKLVPPKSLEVEDCETISLIKVIIVNPSGKSFIKQYRQRLAESFLLQFPSDFNQLQQRAAPSLYRLRININKENLWNTKFVV